MTTLFYDFKQIGENIHGEKEGDKLGQSVSMASNSSRIAIGAPYNDDNENTLINSGEVKIYDVSGNTLSQVGESIKGDKSNDNIGKVLSMSGNGNRVGVNSNSDVKIYELSGNIWTQIGDAIKKDITTLQIYNDTTDNTFVVDAIVPDQNIQDQGENYYTIYDDSTGNVKLNVNGGQLQAEHNIQVENGKTYTVIFNDFYGDGMSVQSGTEFKIHNTVIFNSDELNGFDSLIEKKFTVVSSPSSISLSDNGNRIAVFSENVKIYDLSGNIWTQIGDTIKKDIATLQIYNDTTDNTFVVDAIVPDQTISFQDENSYTITDDSTGNNKLNVSSGQLQAEHNIQVENGKTYTITFSDSFGDGISVQPGTEFKIHNTVIFNSDELNGFGSTLTKKFTVTTDNRNFNASILELSLIQISGDGSRICISDNYKVKIYDIVGNIFVNQGEIQGSTISLSHDNNLIAIGEPDINGDYGNGNIQTESGRVRVYKKNNSSWSQIGQDILGKRFDALGKSIALTTIKGAPRLIIGAPGNNSHGNFGYARVYDLIDNSWSQLGSDINSEEIDDQTGHSVAMSKDGTTIVVSAPLNGNDSGLVKAYKISHLHDKLLSNEEDLESLENDMTSLQSTINDIKKAVMFSAFKLNN